MLLVAEPCLGEDEKAALAEVISSGWITMGDRVRAFERAFAAVHQALDAVAVDSCTAGLHLSLAAMGIGPGAEVLVPSLTFVATVNSVIYCGATPVFVDIEALDCPHISITDAEAKCTRKTKAAIVMHYGGRMLYGERWREFADARGLALIEDSAHAVGSDRPPVFGDAAVFSFFGNKNMTTAEGGIVLAADHAVLARVRQMRSHGMTAGTLERLKGRTFSYDVTMLGYNYRMDELRAAIGLTQLTSLDHWNQRRAALTCAYRTMLHEICPQVVVPFSSCHPSLHHLMPVMLPEGIDRQHVMEQMHRAGVQTTIHYPPVHRFSWYRDRFPETCLPKTEIFASRELTLPLHPQMDLRQVEIAVYALADALAGQAT
jgi:dTDP-4-amino-4,6-dideoxygalactose transaminase